jgi:8-oxo-dGTP diphosphatase
MYKSKILLLYRQGGRVVNNVWVASAGGHFEESELNDAKSCVIREMVEELGITENVLKNIEMRYVTLRRTKDEIRQNNYFFAELNEEMDFEISSNEGVLKWFDTSELQALEMPYTAKYVIEHYLATGTFNNKMYGGIANGEQVIFTELPEF